MDIRQLRYFLAVAEAGHMTRAAGLLGMAQPPLSQQIKALENTVGMVLFKRHSKGVTLTEAGQTLQADAARLVHDFDALQSRMQLLAEGKTGRLVIAFTSSAAAHEFTPFALRECRARHPGLVLEIGENNAAEITEAVADGRLHCGLLRVPWRGLRAWCSIRCSTSPPWWPCPSTTHWHNASGAASRCPSRLPTWRASP